MTKKQISQILRDVLGSCRYKDGRLIYNSIESMRLFELVKSSFYKPIVDFACVYQTVLDVMPFTNEKEKLLPQQINSLVIKIHEKLDSLPAKINLLIPLPGLSEHMKSLIKINSSVSLLIIDEELLKIYKPDSDNLSGYINRLTNLFKNPANEIEKGDTFFKISTRGFANRFSGFVTEGQDPVYLLKIFVSLQLIYGNLIQSKKQNFQENYIFAYSDDNKLICSAGLPENELRFINNLEFVKSSNSLELINRIFDRLTKQNYSEVINKFGAQIQNSLFWFFEAQKVNNQNLKTVFYVSAFDSFFDQEEKSLAKINRIVDEISDTVQQEKLAFENLNDLYRARNKIIHGERQLFDYSVEFRSTKEKDRARNDVAITNFYNRYLSNKIYKFNKSVMSAETKLLDQSGKVKSDTNNR